jgi:hypothetical protein
MNLFCPMKSHFLLLLCSIGLFSQAYSQIEKPEKHAFPGITNWEDVVAKAVVLQSFVDTKVKYLIYTLTLHRVFFL